MTVEESLQEYNKSLIQLKDALSAVVESQKQTIEFLNLRLEWLSEVVHTGQPIPFEVFSMWKEKK